MNFTNKLVQSERQEWEVPILIRTKADNRKTE